MDTRHENSPFYRILADEGRVAVLDAFLTYGSIPLDVDALQEYTGLSQGQINAHLEVLLTADLIFKKQDEEVYRLGDTKKASLLESYHTNNFDETLEAVIAETSE